MKSDSGNVASYTYKRWMPPQKIYGLCTPVYSCMCTHACICTCACIYSTTYTYMYVYTYSVTERDSHLVHWGVLLVWCQWQSQMLCLYSSWAVSLCDRAIGKKCSADHLCRKGHALFMNAHAKKTTTCTNPWTRHNRQSNKSCCWFKAAEQSNKGD